MVEKRFEPRVREAVRVEVVGEAETISGTTKDLSTRGLFLVTNRRWERGARMTIRIMHLYWTLEVSARVAHQQVDGVGFEFIKTNKIFETGIRDVVESLLANRTWFQERSKYTKALVSGPVVWEQDGLEVEGRLQNANTDYAIIESSEPPEKGSRICLYLPSACSGPDRVDKWEVKGFVARVVRVEQDTFRIEFLDPRPVIRKVHPQG